MGKKIQILETLSQFIIIMMIWAFIIGYPVKIIWNWIMPVIFELPRITFWQAWGMFFLSTILFKNVSFGNESNK